MVGFLLQLSTWCAKGRNFVFADRRGTLSIILVWDQCLRFDEKSWKSDGLLDSWIWSNYNRKIDCICLTIDQKFVSFVVQLAQSAIQILVPGVVQIPIPQNYPAWCSTDAQRTLSWHSGRAPGTLQAVPENSLGALGCPRKVPGPTSWRFCVPRHQNFFKFN